MFWKAPFSLTPSRFGVAVALPLGASFVAQPGIPDVTDTGVYRRIAGRLVAEPTGTVGERGVGGPPNFGLTGELSDMCMLSRPKQVEHRNVRREKNTDQVRRRTAKLASGLAEGFSNTNVILSGTPG